MLNKKLLIYPLVAIICFVVGFGARNYLFIKEKLSSIDKNIDLVQIFVNPPEAKKANPTSKPTPTPTSTSDPDPIVNCDISPKCGSPKMKRSACRQLTCCQVGDKFILLALIR